MCRRPQGCRAKERTVSTRSHDIGCSHKAEANSCASEMIWFHICGWWAFFNSERHRGKAHSSCVCDVVSPDCVTASACVMILCRWMSVQRIVSVFRVKRSKKEPLFLDCFTLKMKALYSLRNVGSHSPEATAAQSSDFVKLKPLLLWKLDIMPINHFYTVLSDLTS